MGGPLRLGVLNSHHAPLPDVSLDRARPETLSQRVRRLRSESCEFGGRVCGEVACDLGTESCVILVLKAV